MAAHVSGISCTPCSGGKPETSTIAWEGLKWGGERGSGPGGQTPADKGTDGFAK